jgi:cbb3-type cytochrome oxidase cytochrome c subunit
MIVLVIIVISIGGLVQIVPLFFQDSLAWKAAISTFAKAATFVIHR